MEYIQAWSLAAARDERTKFQQEPIRHGPRISYTRALAARFVWHDELHTVGTCPLEVLSEFLTHFTACSQLPSHQFREVIDLLSFGELGRWQALDTLLTFGVVLPLERAT